MSQHQSFSFDPETAAAARVPSWLHSVFWQSTAVCFRCTGLENKKNKTMFTSIPHLGKLNVSSDQLMNVHLSPGRTSAGLLWPPLWCSPACHRGCSSCTSGKLTTMRKHLAFTLYGRQKQTPVCHHMIHKKAGTFLEVRHASLRHDGDPGGNVGSFNSDSSLIQSLRWTHKWLMSSSSTCY